MAIFSTSSADAANVSTTWSALCRAWTAEKVSRFIWPFQVQFVDEGLEDTEVVNAPAFVAIARAENDHFNGRRGTDRTVTLPPRPLCQCGAVALGQTLHR